MRSLDSSLKEKFSKIQILKLEYLNIFDTNLTNGIIFFKFIYDSSGLDIKKSFYKWATRQLFSTVTTTTQQRFRASVIYKKTKNM